MGQIKLPEKVRLITGVLFAENIVLAEIEENIQQMYGVFSEKSEILEFKHTSYYEKEMGISLKRRYYAFEKLVDIDELAEMKLMSNSLEDKYLSENKRQINIDPGYIDLAKLVLASTKDFSHRIYIGKGIYAEITLSFRKDSFTPLVSTYPDYKEKRAICFFNKIRNAYHKGLLH